MGERADERIRQGIRPLSCKHLVKGAFLYSFCEKQFRKGRIMKKQITKIVAVLLCVLMLLATVACQRKVDATGAWKDATYRGDRTFGKGAITVEVEVKAGEESITFTIKTDKETLGEALLEHNLIEGVEGAYGLYVKKVNGILADYDVDQSWWCLYKNGEMMMTGVDTTEIADGEHYELVYES